jgi:hypothetical protein
MTVQPIWFEDTIAAVLRSNVAVTIPLLILLIKLMVLRVSGEAQELFRSIVAIPLEIILIAIGTVVAGLSRTIPFESRYRSDVKVDLAGAILILVLALVLAVLNKVNTRLIVYFEKFYVAMQSIKLHISQQGFDFNTASSSTTAIIASSLWYLLMSTLGWVSAMAISIFLLWQVFLRIR